MHLSALSHCCVRLVKQHSDTQNIAHMLLQMLSEGDKDKDGLMAIEEWSTIDLWFQYKAVSGSSPTVFSPACSPRVPALATHVLSVLQLTT